MNIDRQKEIMSHVGLQFEPLRIALADVHDRELKESQFRARKT